MPRRNDLNPALTVAFTVLASLFLLGLATLGFWVTDNAINKVDGTTDLTWVQVFEPYFYTGAVFIGVFTIIASILLALDECCWGVMGLLGGAVVLFLYRFVCLEPFINMLLFLDGETISRGAVGGWLIFWGIFICVGWFGTCCIEVPSKNDEKIQYLGNLLLLGPIGVCSIVFGVFINEKLEFEQGVSDFGISRTWFQTLIPQIVLASLNVFNSFIKLVSSFHGETSKLGSLYKVCSSTVFLLFWINLASLADHSFTGIQAFWYFYISIGLLAAPAIFLLLGVFCYKTVDIGTDIVHSIRRTRHDNRNPTPPTYSVETPPPVPPVSTATVHPQPQSLPSYAEATASNKIPSAPPVTPEKV